MLDLLRAARVSLRSLAKRPTVSLSIVATWSLSVGLAMVILAVLHAAWVQPTDYPRVEQLVDVLLGREEVPDRRFGLSGAEWQGLLSARSFAEVGAYLSFGTSDLTGDGEPERLERHLVTAGYFRTIGIAPLLGRTFTDEEVEEDERLVVLSHGLWTRRFGGDTEVLGRTLRLDGEPWEVVGVMPSSFGARGGLPDLWAPLSFGPHRPYDRKARFLGAIGRLQPAVTLGQATVELEGIMKEIDRRFPDSDTTVRFDARPLAAVMTAPFRRQRFALLGGALFVLLVAAVDVTSLQLARGLSRAHEMRVRRALGAGRRRIVASILFESALLALAGGLLGCLLAALTLDLMPDLRGRLLHGWIDLGVGPTVAAAGLTLATVLGLASALPAAISGLRGAAGRPFDRGQMPSPTRGRWRAAMVVSQAALSVLLLAGATMAVRSLVGLGGADLGFEADDLVVMEVAPPPARYAGAPQVVAFYEQLLDALAARPELGGVGLVNEFPGEGWGFGAEVDDRPDIEAVSAEWLLASPGLLEALGVPLLDGRHLQPTDRGGAPPVMVVTEGLAKALVPDGSLLGQRIGLGEPVVSHQVVGVIGDVRSDPTLSHRPAVWVDYRQQVARGAIEDLGIRGFQLLVKSELGIDQVAALVRQELDSIDREVPLSGVVTANQRLRESIFRPRFDALMLSTFAALALLLASVGLYGTLRFHVTERSSELGVRIALGALPTELIRAVVGRGLAQVAIGVFLGLAAAVASHQVLASFLYGVSALDPRSHLVAAVTLLAAAALAAWMPARRIAHVDPVSVLRSE